MAAKRIVPNTGTGRFVAAKSFRGGVPGMRAAMDHGPVVTPGGEGAAAPRTSFAAEGGSGTPDLAAAVDDLKACGAVLAADLAVEHPPPLPGAPAPEPRGCAASSCAIPQGEPVDTPAHGRPGRCRSKGRRSKGRQSKGRQSKGRESKRSEPSE